MINKIKEKTSLIIGAAVIVSALFLNVKNAYAQQENTCTWDAENHYCVHYERYNEGLCHAGGDISCQDEGQIIIIIEDN